MQHRDITNASRRIKQLEVDRCAKNGVADIIEIKVGYDGIVIGNAKSGPDMDISRKQIFMALAKNETGADICWRERPERSGDQPRARAISGPERFDRV